MAVSKTTVKLISKYGNPLTNQLAFEQKYMTVLKYSDTIKKEIPALGETIYCNKDLVVPYETVLMALIKAGLHKEIRKNDQCFCVRAIRGSQDISVHSWAMAIDLNPEDNPLGLTRNEALAKGLTPFSDAFQQVWRDNNWLCGIDFARKDGMHFQYTKFL